MNPQPSQDLPSADQSLLRILARVVPAKDRREWTRTWHAELWHLHHGRRGRRGVAEIRTLAFGVALDAMWLRTESWRQAFNGTATLCLGELLGLNLIAATLALLLQGSWNLFSPALTAAFEHTVVATPLVIFVGLATNVSRHAEQGAKKSFRMRQQLFSVGQIVLVLLLAFFTSAGVCLPAHANFLNTSDLLQVFCFVLFALLGLRWAIRDREQRCKQCMRSLTVPARIGRPSHNLLEWNGMESNCREGHGKLSVPEIETSWCQSSEWIDLNVA